MLRRSRRRGGARDEACPHFARRRTTTLDITVEAVDSEVALVERVDVTGAGPGNERVDLSIDEDVAIIGTSNMDIRSLSLHMELMVMLVGESVVADLRTVQDSYRANSRELTLDEWLQRPRREKWLDNLMRLTSALM